MEMGWWKVIGCSTPITSRDGVNLTIGVAGMNRGIPVNKQTNNQTNKQAVKCTNVNTTYVHTHAAIQTIIPSTINLNINVIDCYTLCQLCHSRALSGKLNPTKSINYIYSA